MTRPIDWESFLSHDGKPMDQSQAEMVILFAQGDSTRSVFWEKSLDRLVCIPRNDGTRTRMLNDYISICLEQQDDGTLGFQLCAFSRAAPYIWKFLDRGTGDRVSLREILHFYEGMIVLSRSYQPALGNQAFEFMVEKFQELRDRFGHITIFQPEHARTIAL